MSPLIPQWRSFQTVSSDAEAASFSPYCRFSLATLEVACDPETKSFALTERERPGVWRWAIISARGAILHDGRESSQGAAKRIAAGAMKNDLPPTADFIAGWRLTLPAFDET